MVFGAHHHQQHWHRGPPARHSVYAQQGHWAPSPRAHPARLATTAQTAAHRPYARQTTTVQRGPPLLPHALVGGSRGPTSRGTRGQPQEHPPHRSADATTGRGSSGPGMVSAQRARRGQTRGPRPTRSSHQSRTGHLHTANRSVTASATRAMQCHRTAPCARHALAWAQQQAGMAT